MLGIFSFWYYFNEGNNWNNDDVNTPRKFKISTNLSWNFKAMGFAAPSTEEQNFWDHLWFWTCIFCQKKCGSVDRLRHHHHHYCTMSRCIFGGQQWEWIWSPIVNLPHTLNALNTKYIISTYIWEHSWKKRLDLVLPFSIIAMRCIQGLIIRLSGVGHFQLASTTMKRGRHPFSWLQ